MKIIIIIGIIALLLIAYFGIGYYVFLKVHRRPKKRVGVTLKGLEKEQKIFEAQTSMVNEVRKWFFSSGVEKVTVQSYDGLKLCGEYLRADEPRGTIILVHGYRSSGTRDYAPALKFLHELGLNIIIIKQRASGDSEGDYSTFGLKERIDCRSWCEKANELFPGKPVFLFGMSQGCATVLLSTETGLPENVAGIIADCGYTTPWISLKYLFDRYYHIPCLPVLSAVNFWVWLKTGFSMRKCNTVDAMKKNRIPVLFVHGDDDKFVPISCTMANYEACAAEKELYISKGAAHTLSLSTNTEEYLERIRSFVNSHI